MLRQSFISALVSVSLFADCQICNYFEKIDYVPTFSKNLIFLTQQKADCTTYAPMYYWVNNPAENFSAPYLVSDTSTTGKALAFTYSNGTVYKISPACTQSSSNFFFDGNGVPVSTSVYVKNIFTDSSSIIGTGLIMSGYLLTAAGAVAVTMGAGGFGVAAIGMLGTSAILAGVGSVIYGIASNTTVSSNTSVMPSNDVQTPDGRIKISLKETGDTQVVKTDNLNRVTEITTVPKTVVDKMASATVDRSTKTTSMTQDEVQGVVTTYYNYDTSTASTYTTGNSTPVDTPFSYSSNNDGSVSVTSSNPSVAPNYDGTTQTVSSVSNSTNNSTGTNSGSYDSSVNVSDAAGSSNTSGADFGTPPDFDGPDDSIITDVYSQYSEALTNLNDNFNQIKSSYETSRSLFENGFDSSRLNIDTSSSCSMSFSLFGHSVPIDLTYFSFLYPLFYSIFFLLLHFLGIRVYIKSAKMGLS